MVSTRWKRQSNRRLLCQLDYFNQDMVIGNAASERQENNVVNEGTNDRDFTVGTSSNKAAINENVVKVKTLERCFNERFDKEMSNIVDSVEDRIQIAILTAIGNIFAPKTELAIRSINESSGRDVTRVTANSERREHVGINASFENELSVPETHLDRQTHTHHMVTGQTAQTNQIPEFPSGRILTPRNPPPHQHQNLSTQGSEATIYQWLNKHQEIKTMTQTIPLIVYLIELQELQPNNDHKRLQCSNQYLQIH